MNFMSKHHTPLYFKNAQSVLLYYSAQAVFIALHTWKFSVTSHDVLQVIVSEITNVASGSIASALQQIHRWSEFFVKAVPSPFQQKNSIVMKLCRRASARGVGGRAEKYFFLARIYK